MSLQVQEKYTITNEEKMLSEVESTINFCKALMKNPLYAKNGEAGNFAIVQKAKSVGLDVLDALNGGMFYLNGKVEMYGMTMLAIIRKHKHSVTFDISENKVTATGRRADNGDCVTVSFSIDDAKRAGIMKGTYEKYPTDMLVWRCVSKLGRFLFSDILKGCYVMGELSGRDLVGNDAPLPKKDDLQEVKIEEPKTNAREFVELGLIIKECSPEFISNVNAFFESQNIKTHEDLKLSTYKTLLNRAKKEREVYQNQKLQLEEKTEQEEIQEELTSDE